MNKLVSKKMFWLLVTISTFLYVPTASADIFQWDLDWVNKYVQIANNVQPATSDGSYFWSSVEFDQINDAGTVTINHSSWSSPRSYIDVNGDGTTWELEFDYGTQTGLLNAFPDNTNYTVSISGGNLGSQSYNVVIGLQNFPAGTGIPYLTNNSFDNLQGMNVHANLDISWNNPTGTMASFYIENPILGEDVYETNGPGLTGTTIPAKTLGGPNVDYEFCMVLGAWNQGLTGTTLPGIGTYSFCAENSGKFTTGNPVPVPGAALLLGSGLLGFFAIKRRR